MTGLLLEWDAVDSAVSYQRERVYENRDRRAPPHSPPPPPPGLRCPPFQQLIDGHPRSEKRVSLSSFSGPQSRWLWVKTCFASPVPRGAFCPSRQSIVFYRPEGHGSLHRAYPSYVNSDVSDPSLRRISTIVDRDHFTPMGTYLWMKTLICGNKLLKKLHSVPLRLHI